MTGTRDPDRNPVYAAAVAASALVSLLTAVVVPIPEAIEGLPWMPEHVVRLAIASATFWLLYRMVTATWLAYRGRTWSSAQTEQETGILDHFDAAASSLEGLIRRIEEAAKLEQAEEEASGDA